MKKALFYLFLAIFGITAIVTVLGITGFVTVKDAYLTPLFWSLLIEVIGAIIAIYRRADFLSDGLERDLQKYSPSKDAGRVLATLWAYQRQHCGSDKNNRWGMALPPDTAQMPTFYRGLADLIEVGLADVNRTDSMAHLTSEGFDYCTRRSDNLTSFETFKF